ncbi:hypothetical protein BCUN_0195 [Bifidobacterium cuniculi]|uniref:ABC-2 family transporter protein n=2 Tax=Bifidobacterium cuniculi TaxID=1688 RepID=A0A087B3V0_9BIFI|nr:hypothetical protein BCUN_0195 [Bifidobacterium cuniculi]
MIKGLMMRDWRVLRHQGFLLVFTAALTALYMASGMLQFGQCFAPLMLSLMVLRAVCDDLQSSHARALFTLPFTRGAYVWEKMLLGLGAPIALTAILGAVATLSGRQDVHVTLVLCAAMACGLALMAALFLPLTICFGERAIIAMPLAMAVLVLVVVCYGNVVGDRVFDAMVQAVEAWMRQVPPAMPYCAAAAITLVLALGSGALSAWLLRRQDL